ncbi:hypothetical protein PRUPE_5G215200 [Prunus persica]|uniref:protein-synthesizing GTPase n=1 Tax=Prunus persica TaxID=3760 RepID=A0A251PDF8_PRUPE|nr:hypothetical protein PRUPE_5G215200 [Prunus persica]
MGVSDSDFDDRIRFFRTKAPSALNPVFASQTRKKAAFTEESNLFVDSECNGCIQMTELDFYLDLILSRYSYGHYTMLNGATIMDGALLLNVANESCPQPQTSEHLAAVEIMCLQHIIILQNKVDLIQENVAINQHEGTIADNAPVVPISAQLKYNIDVVCEYIVKKIPFPERNFISPPNMIVIRSFDVNKPGFEVNEIRGCLENEPIYRGGLIGVGTTMDPTLTRADRLVGQVLGEVGSLPEVFVELEMMFPRKLSKGARVIAVRNDLAKLQLTSPVCTSRGIAFSRRVEKHCRLIGPYAWSKAIGTVVAGGDLVASVGDPSRPEQTKKTSLWKKFHRHMYMAANICRTSLDEHYLCRQKFF